jgi:hypothetical protein
MEDPDFGRQLMGLAVHDLRNALNSVQLSLHLIQTSPPGTDLGADLAMLEASVEANRQMVEILGIYVRCLRELRPPRPAPRSPTALLRDAMAACERSRSASDRVNLAPGRGEDAIVTTDPELATRAVTLALANAIDASRQAVVWLVSDRREADRWRVEIKIPEAPPPTIVAGPVDPGRVEHLTASPYERRTLDLALVGWLSERLGGSARIEVEPGCESRIVLDWPAHLPNPAV